MATRDMATKVKKTEKPRKFPWQRLDGKLVDDLRLVTSINELIWRSFDEKEKCNRLPVFGHMSQADTAVFKVGQTDSKRGIFKMAGLLPKFWLMPLDEYRRWIRVLCTDVEKAKRLIFRIRENEHSKMYEYESHLREMGLKAELLFVGMLDQSKAMACPECGCYAIFRIPGTNRCIVVFLYGDGGWKRNGSDGGDAYRA